MKRAGLFVAAILLLGTAIPSFAQQTADTASQYPKDVYYKVVPLMKVLTGSLGYEVKFFNSSGQVQTDYLPMAWFNNGPTSKADIVYGLGPTLPYMSVYWADGKFDHVTLYVSSDDNSLTNGVLSQNTDLSSQFNVQEIPRNF
jgi:hypothetical protein